MSTSTMMDALRSEEMYLNAVSGVNHEGLVDGVVASEGLTGIRVGHALGSTSTSGLRDTGALVRHARWVGGRKSKAEQVPRPKAQASSDAVKREAEMNGRGFRSERGSVIM